MGRPTQAVILLKALTNNWTILKRYASKKGPLIPVLKANAYGHGATIIALHLQKLGVTKIAVALLEEAQELRAAGFKKKILLLGPFASDQVKDLQKLDVIPVIGSMTSLFLLTKLRSGLNIHLKWETNMNRLGLHEEELPQVMAFLKAQPQIKVKGLCTHLLCGEDLGTSKGHSAQQLRSFSKIVKHFQKVYKPLVLHVFNSDAFFQQIKRSIYSLDFGARIGLGLYGYSSVNTEVSGKLKPVMKLISQIVQIKKIRKGESVSYNATWTAQRDSVIALVPMGYADGYRRALSNKGQVLVRGMLVSVVGTVCMDYFMIDVTDLDNQQPLALGEEIELWGPNVDLKELAKKIDTIPYELLTTLGSRVGRVAVDSIK